MKNATIKVIFVLCIGLSAKAQNIGIGTNAPHASAQLDMTAANKGLLIPRMALANRPASPATGLLIYQTNSTPGFYYYDGSSWVALKTPAFSLPYTGSTTSDNAFEITSTGGEAIVGNSQGPGASAGGEFTSSSTTGRGVRATATNTAGANVGGQFTAGGTEGVGVAGISNNLTGANYGGYFNASGSLGTGIAAYATHATGATVGVLAASYSSAGVGIFGRAESATGETYGIRAQNNSTQGGGIKSFATAATGATIGVDGESNSTTGIGVFGYANAATGINYGVNGGTSSPSGYGGYFRNSGGGAGVALATGTGNVEFLTLAGSGNRMVMASSTGRLIAQPVQWITNGNKMYNANNGFVGIGISNPAVNLQVNDAIEGSSEGNILITNQLTGTANSDGLRIRMNFFVASIQNNENGDLFFQTNQGSTGDYGSPAIWIKPSGAIGIGTSTPGAKLEVAGVGSAQPAININNGYLKVSGANKTAFTVTGTAENASGHILTLSYANQSATDILLVTHNYNPGGVGGTYHNIAVGVFWNTNTWTIYSEDATTPMLGKSFNVLVIKQ